MTRSAALTHRNRELLAQNTDYETVFTTIVTAPESEAIDHLRRLRNHAAVNEYAEMLRISTSQLEKNTESILRTPL
jgi:hypothetical protein